MDEDSRLLNRLAALAVALTDEIGEATERAAGAAGAAPAALVALHESAAGESVDRLRLMVGLTASGAVRLVDRLVSLGLVER
nr:MarR family transcriptional regulator [Actinomycetota bacterium]